jgi:hypothetical protein
LPTSSGIVDDVERGQDNVLLRRGGDPCVLPEAVRCLVVELIDGARRGHSLAGAQTDRRWLCPGSRAGYHLCPERLHIRLYGLGIRVRDARRVAMLNLAVDVPVGVPAEMLGIGSRAASRWSSTAGGGWADYAS